MKTLARIAILATFAALPTLVYAEDIEIYMSPQLPAGSEPLVMFTIDYRPNLASTVADQSDFFVPLLGADDPDLPTGSWTFFDIIRLSLKVVFQEVDGVKVGLMMNHDYAGQDCAGPQGALPKSNTNQNCSNGAYILMGFESLGDEGVREKFADKLRAIPVPQGNLSHSWQGKELFFEFFRYLTGGEVWNARNGYHDFAGDREVNLDEEFPEIAWDEDIMSFKENRNGVPIYQYESPLDAASSCTRIFTINMMFNVANQDGDSDNAIRAARDDGGMGGINLHGSSNDVSTVIKYLYDADLGDGTYGTAPQLSGQQNVVSYFVMTPNNFQPRGYQYANAGGTQLPIALASEPQELIDTLTDIFRQILSVSTTFVAASVPVNVFNRSEIVDNVYIALFQADKDSRPSWPGSLKKLRLEQEGDVVRLVDQIGQDAVAADGRINHAALTYWTIGNELPPPRAEHNEIEDRDGRSVDRGGAGQRIPGFLGSGPGAANADGARQLFTEPDTIVNGTPTVMRALNADEATAGVLQAAIGTETTDDTVEMLKWIRGMDVDNLHGDEEIPTTVARPWILGDPLHSRPLPINYGARGGHDFSNPDIRIVMGSNDGYLRMFRNTSADGEQLGEEVWGFMPRTVMQEMHKLRADTPTQSGYRHPYTVDGAPVVFVADSAGDGTIGDGDQVVVYIGLRRGGRAYYAIDASNPDDPRFLWRITKDDAGFEELGWTFSTPQVGHIRTGGERRPVLVFGGGYDLNKDVRPKSAVPDSEGNAIYIVDALDGSLVWKAVGSGSSSNTVFVHEDMVDAIPSDVTALDTSGDGFLDRVYVGDTGGTVWRLDLPRADGGQGDSDPALFSASVLAYLGRHYSADIADDRRFFHAPDVVLSKDADGAFDAVILGAGNRENPLDTDGANVENWVYMIKDRNTQVGSVPENHVAFDHESFGDVTDNCLQEDPENCETVPDLENGWRLALVEAHGEKSLAVPFAISGTVFFTTYLPPGTAEAATCGPSEGGGLLYAVALADASSTINFDTTDDDPDRPGEATTRSDRTRSLRSGGIPAEVVSLGGGSPPRILLPDLSTETVPGTMRWRTFWFENEDPNG